MQGGSNGWETGNNTDPGRFNAGLVGRSQRVHQLPQEGQKKRAAMNCQTRITRQETIRRDKKMGGEEIAGGIFRQRPRSCPLRSEVGDLCRYWSVVCGGGAE